uniref:Uncharacterized protein n=1 Tax=Anguilla anguilla TaxID=7936 RepID=A0A0E9RV00_ANGAN
MLFIQHLHAVLQSKCIQVDHDGGDDNDGLLRGGGGDVGDLIAFKNMH